MTLEQLNSLNEDELAMLWYAVNKTTPPVLADIELDPSVFCSIKQHAIQSRVDQIKLAVKDEYKLIYDSLRQKLNMAPLDIPKPDETASDAPTILPTQISGSESA